MIVFPARRPFFLALIYAAVLLAACGQNSREAAPAPDGPCLAEAEAQIAFSNPDAPDTLRAEASGATCAEAQVRLTLSDPSGAALWSFESPYVDLAFGGPPAPNTPAPSRDDVARFLSAWVAPSEKRSSEMPPWREGASQPGLGGEGLSYSSRVARGDYERLRTQNSPILCLAATVDESQCIARDAQSGAVVLMLGFGP